MVILSRPCRVVFVIYLFCVTDRMAVSKTLRGCWLLLVVLLQQVAALPRPAAYKDNSVKGYLAERSCWGNEICKEEFQTQFRCRCPQWSFCRSPGRYYNAYCSMTGTGYIWVQAY